MWGDRYIPMSYFDSLADARVSLKENSIKALELQTSLLEWLRTTTSQDAYTQFMQVYGYTKVSNEVSRRSLGVWLHGQVRDAAETSPTYYVSGDMCEMVRMGAATLDVTEGLVPEDMPTDKGFLVFDRPMEITGPGGVRDGSGNYVMKGETVRISAILWEATDVGQVDPSIVGEDRYSPMDRGSMPTAPGVKYWMFMTPHDAAVVINQGLKEEMNDKLRAMGMELPEPIVHLDAATHKDIKWVDEHHMRRTQGPLNIYDFSGWTFGQPWAEVPYGTPEGEKGFVDGVFQTHPIVNQVRRILLSTWRMLGQRIVRVETNGLGKNHPTRKRASRMMPCTGDILIIRLRREFSPRRQLEELGEPGEVWWTHRWTVRGHWRRPKGSAPDAPKSEFVSPYVKGPAHLPLIMKDKIFSLEQ